MFPESPKKSRHSLNNLTDMQVRAFVATAHKTGVYGKKLFDGGGLFIKVSPAGTALWLLKYELGTEKTISFGKYPTVSLEEARRKRDAAKALIDEGQDPVKARRVKRRTRIAADNATFGHAFTGWLAQRQKEWSGIHFKNSSRAFERDVLPAIGKLPVDKVTSAMVYEVVKAIEGRGALDTAKKVLQHCGGVFDYAIVMGWCSGNPVGPVKGQLAKKKWTVGMPAILDFPGLGSILRDADMARLSPAVKMAHRLVSFTACRMGNISEAVWSEFHLDVEHPVWIIPRSKMKAKDRGHDHKVFLSAPITEELRRWRDLTGGEGYLFPTPTRNGTRPISREAVEKAYRETLKLQGRHAPHGWRSALTTLAGENGFEEKVVELALDHVRDNEVIRAYDRGQHLAARIRLMEWWGEQLVKAQKGDNLIAFPEKKIA